MYQAAFAVLGFTWFLTFAVGNSFGGFVRDAEAFEWIMERVESVIFEQTDLRTLVATGSEEEVSAVLAQMSTTELERAKNEPSSPIIVNRITGSAVTEAYRKDVWRFESVAHVFVHYLYEFIELIWTLFCGFGFVVGGYYMRNPMAADRDA